MNKLIWAILAIVLVIIGFFVFSGGDDSQGEDIDEENVQAIVEDTIDDAPDSDFNELESSDEVFDEIDSALEFA